MTDDQPSPEAESDPLSSPERGNAPGGPSKTADADAFTLHTGLLGELVVPGGAPRAAELEALAARAAVYATRARGEGTGEVQNRVTCRAAGRLPHKTLLSSKSGPHRPGSAHACVT